MHNSAPFNVQYFIFTGSVPQTPCIVVGRNDPSVASSLAPTLPQEFSFVPYSAGDFFFNLAVLATYKIKCLYLAENALNKPCLD